MKKPKPKTALSSFKLYNEKSAVSSLNKNEINALKTLSKNKDLIIQKSDKGTSIVLINKSDYLDKMYNILSVQSFSLFHTTYIEDIKEF